MAPGLAESQPAPGTTVPVSAARSSGRPRGPSPRRRSPSGRRGRAAAAARRDRPRRRRRRTGRCPPARGRATTVAAIAASTRRSAASAGPSADRSRPRTSAVRSFVPMEKKSTLRREGGRGRGGGGQLHHHAERRRVTPAALAALASSTRTSSTSSSERTIGIMIARSVPAPASRIAASCAARAPGARRNAGRPAAPGNGGILSPAKSSSRTTARLPPSRLSTGVSAARCSPRSGQPAARRERDLGAEQADAGRAVGQAEAGLRRRGDVAQDRDELAVGGAAGRRMARSPAPPRRCRRRRRGRGQGRRVQGRTVVQVAGHGADDAARRRSRRGPRGARRAR